MSRFFAPALSLMTTALLSSCAANSLPKEAQFELAEAYRVIDQANLSGDRSSLQAVYAADFKGWMTEPLSRESVLGGGKTEGLQSFKTSVQSVVVEDGVAYASVLNEVSMAQQAEGKTGTSLVKFYRVDEWVKANGRWQLRESTLTLLESSGQQGQTVRRELSVPLRDRQRTEVKQALAAVSHPCFLTNPPAF
ncbi:nuclear transport factor 2 family protein [Deinococcus lacus]|uniref:Nuclear transport factor 2 family protein n=1 Tax=Deinococcus lacus TaxID=392561 RepID=A0ABW1YGN7_9DEIO